MNAQRETPIRSGLARLAASEPASDADLAEMARRVWQERGVIVLWPERILNDFDRQQCVNVAERAYGKRRG